MMGDFTGQKRAEALRECEERYRAVTQSAADAIVSLDSAGNIVGWNRGAEKIFGYSEAEAFGQPATLLMPPRFRDGHLAGMLRVQAGGEPHLLGKIVEMEGVHKDGVEFPLEMSLSTWQVADGRNYYTGIIRDISERKRFEEEKRKLEEQVRRTQRQESLGVLAGGIAHDFNNILMVVLGHAELALNETPPHSSVRENLTEIMGATRRAADLCREMLVYAGKATITVERVGLKELVQEMATLLETAIAKKASLTLELESGLPPIEADRSQIRQIVLNLILNASEAIGDRGGAITVSAGATRCGGEDLRKTDLHDELAPGPYVYLEVSDTGTGMDAETLSRIFEPFFSTRFTGRGLGLAAVLGIVRAHKGAVKVWSEPGKGTTFKILFPALAGGEDSIRSPEDSPLAGWRGKGTILLVDDEESLLALGARMLEYLGLNALTASDGVQAVELYRRHREEIDLVLMDLTMPHMDGEETLGELRRLNPDVPVVLASGHSHEDVTGRFAGKGLAGILQKPYTLARLRETLAGLLPERLA